MGHEEQPLSMSRRHRSTEAMMEDDANDDSTDGKYAELGKKGVE